MRGWIVVGRDMRAIRPFRVPGSRVISALVRRSARPLREEGIPVIDRRGVDLSMEDGVAAVDETARVAVRTGIADRCRSGRLGSVSLRRRGHRLWTQPMTAPTETDRPKSAAPA